MRQPLKILLSKDFGFVTRGVPKLLVNQAWSEGEAFFRALLTSALPIPRLNRMEHLGGCHCGNIHVRLRLSKRPEDNPLRACTCSFCRSHSPRMVADLEGLFEVWADDWSLVENYRFGTRICDFLICRRCGVFIAAVAETTAGSRAVVNVNCLIDRGRFMCSCKAK